MQPTRTSPTASLACAVAAVLLAAVPLAPTAGAAGPAIPSPSPPTHYSNTTACVGAADAGATLKNGVSWAQTQLDYPAQWVLAGRGAGQKIAVIDTGVNPVGAFSGRLAAGGDYVVQNGSGLVDCDGHGTVVAGIIAASPDSRSGFAGVAPAAQLISIRQSSSYYGVKNAEPGSADRVAGTTATLAQAILFAVSKGAKIINISEASCRKASAKPDPGLLALTAAVRYAIAMDVVVVAAAGNVDSSTDCKVQNTHGADPRTIPTPADIPGVLAVGAAEENGRPAQFSLHGTWVGVAAPGVHIISTNPVQGTSGQIGEFSTQSGVSPIQGTSFAAPYVSGLVALVRARFPHLSAPKVIARVERTAEHPAAPGDHDDLVGYGMINPAAALTDVLPGEEDGVTPPPRFGPSVLPATQPRPDRERTARLTALTGSLGLLVVTVGGAIVVSTRRRHAASLARGSGLRAAAGGRRRR